MAHRTVFDDERGNTLSFYMNKDGMLYFEIIDPSIEIYYNTYITLDMSDVVKLRDELNALIIEDLND